MLKVAKFGGSSLAGANQFIKVKKIVTYDKSIKVVVPSAPGKRNKDDEKITDLLYLLYDEISKGLSYSKTFKKIRERYEEIIEDLNLNLNLDFEFEKIKENCLKGYTKDYVASRGEYLNAIILSEYLGYEFVDAAELIFFNDKGEYNEISSNEEIGQRLDKNKFYVVPGFYGSMPDGSIRTFSRGGSDITGAIISGALKVDIYENWTDVSGFLVADPKIISDSEIIDVITYRELRELSYMGAGVLHEDSIFPVKAQGIPINIRNTDRPNDKGTMIVSNTCKTPKYTITGIAGKKGFCSINIDKAMMNAEIGFCRKVLQIFDDNNVNIEHLPSGIDTMSIIVDKNLLEDKEQKIISGIHREVAPDSIEIESSVALIAIVGRAMKSNKGTAGRIFAALAHAGINIKMIDQGPREFNIIVGVKEEDFENAIKAIYDIFVLTN